MTRPFLFLSGEFRVTQPLVFQHESWSHTMVTKKFILSDDGMCRRENNFIEKLAGFIYYADVENKEIENYNLQLIIDNDIPCWPDPKVLITLNDRHQVMKYCSDMKLITHNVIQCKFSDEYSINYPFVIKTGNLHRGQGKFLIKNYQDIPIWDGIATIEPYFEGISCRVLWIGDKHFCIRYDNDENWVKNSFGCEVSLWPKMPQSIINHSKQIKELFGLEICGIDYVVSNDGVGHFLEYNQFPGLDIDDSITPIAIQFLSEKIKDVEEKAKVKYGWFFEQQCKNI